MVINIGAYFNNYIKQIPGDKNSTVVLFLKIRLQSMAVRLFVKFSLIP